MAMSAGSERGSGNPGTVARGILKRRGDAGASEADAKAPAAKSSATSKSMGFRFKVKGFAESSVESKTL